MRAVCLAAWVLLVACKADAPSGTGEGGTAPQPETAEIRLTVDDQRPVTVALSPRMQSLPDALGPSWPGDWTAVEVEGADGERTVVRRVAVERRGLELRLSASEFRMVAPGSRSSRPVPRGMAGLDEAPEARVAQPRFITVVTESAKPVGLVTRIDGKEVVLGDAAFDALPATSVGRNRSVRSLFVVAKAAAPSFAKIVLHGGKEPLELSRGEVEGQPIFVKRNRRGVYRVDRLEGGERTRMVDAVARIDIFAAPR